MPKGSKNRELTARERDVLDRLESVLNDRGMSWAEAARLSGRSGGLGNQWSSRRSFPRHQQLDLLSQRLGFAMGWLLTGEEPQADTTAVTKAEKEALAALRKIPPQLQPVAIAQLKALAEGITKK